MTQVSQNFSPTHHRCLVKETVFLDVVNLELHEAMDLSVCVAMLPSRKKAFAFHTTGQ